MAGTQVASVSASMVLKRAVSADVLAAPEVLLLLFFGLEESRRMGIVWAAEVNRW